MVNNLFAIIGLIAVIIVIIGFILYVVTTNRIINEQEQEIIKQHERIMLLEGVIRKQKLTELPRHNDIKFGD